MSSLRWSFACIYVFITIRTLSRCPDYCDHAFSQKDFDEGTVRIRESGTYCIIEHIEFNPKSSWIKSANEEGAYFPTNDTICPGSMTHRDGAFALGFFAVITIEASGVTLDLCGNEIEFGYTFYIQQRFGAIIEIANQPFLPGEGPGTHWGSNFIHVDDVHIRNGILGLSSHHGIHSNGASNVVIEDLVIRDFEVCGVQMNGFRNVSLRNLDIGPSLHDVPLSGYYSNARFLLLALRQLIDEYESIHDVTPFTTFYGERTLSLRDIESNLVHSMDLIFGILTGFTDQTSAESDDQYQVAMDLFLNHDSGLPDGSAIYGILLNSHGLAVGGFGESVNDQVDHGQSATIRNVHIHDLALRVNEIPALYLDECGGDPNSITINKGPFGDIFDLKKVIPSNDEMLIEQHGVDSSSLSGIVYEGNPLSDAQIALSIHGDDDSMSRHNTFGTVIAMELRQWTLGLIPFPSDCAHFVCNGDVMFHENKGVIGLRMDGIEDVQITDVLISNLQNESPSISSVCDGTDHSNDAMNVVHDGEIGALSTSDNDNDGDEVSTDTKGIVITGGDTRFIEGCIMITDLDSVSGDTVALQTIGDSYLDFDRGVDIMLHGISESDGDAQCKVKYSDSTLLNGKIPDGMETINCHDQQTVLEMNRAECGPEFQEMTPTANSWRTAPTPRPTRRIKEWL